MVTISIPAKMSCVDPGCEAHVPVQLALHAGGGFVFKPTVPSKDWQVVSDKSGVVLCRCPKHNRTLAVVEGVR